MLKLNKYPDANNHSIDNLNTSYVEVKLVLNFFRTRFICNLNTSYVEVKLLQRSKGVLSLVQFKYILC